MTEFLPPTYVTNAGIQVWLNPYTGRYTTSKSYAQRMQRNYARGITQSSARGHAAREGLSESQRRRLRSQETFGMTPYERFGFGFERRYGFSYRQWRRWRRRYVDDINAYAWPTAPSSRMQFDGMQRKDPRVFPSDIKAVKDLYDGGYRDPVHSSPATWDEWVEVRLNERLGALIAYHEDSDLTPGRAMYDNQSRTWLSVNMLGGASSGPPIELWWYH